MAAHVDDFIEVKAEKLVTEDYVQRVMDPGAGAIATFTGCTRDNFDGKAVTKLDYEAYVPMAEKTMREICTTARSRWDVKKIAMGHAIGEVGICGVSVVIAVSSAHRKEALEACAWAIDELKSRVPIWKKEFFTDGSMWKENAESRAGLARAAAEHAGVAQAAAGTGAEGS